MIVFQKLTRLANRAVFTETGPKSVKRGPGEAKPLRPQASRLQKELTSRRLRHHYVVAQVCMVTTLALWVAAPILPSSSEHLDMSAIRLSLHLIALMTTFGGLFQAWAMSRTTITLDAI